MELSFHNAAIIGVGLIGGSLGLALKQTFPSIHVRGVGRDPKRLEIAREMDAIDEIAIKVDFGLRDRDLIILATPIERILEMLPSLGACLGPGTVVTDVGSTKRMICERAWAILPPSVEFIGGHPIAGREVAGVENALPGLFMNAPYVLCPRPEMPQENLYRLRSIIEGMGARFYAMTPEAHDQALAWLSHLPQLISTGLAAATDIDLLDLSGPGFRGLTRLAASPYSIWEGILQTNADKIEQALDMFAQQIQTIREELKTNRLSAEFERAAEAYSRLRKT
jgi:prephenate dehydrogenase